MSHHQLLAEALIRDRLREAAAARRRSAFLGRHHQRRPITRLIRRGLRLRPT